MRTLVATIALLLIALVGVSPAAAGAVDGENSNTTTVNVGTDGNELVAAVSEAGPGSQGSGQTFGGSSAFDACVFHVGLSSEELFSVAGRLGLTDHDIDALIENPPADGWSVGLCPSPILDNATAAYWPTGTTPPESVVLAVIRSAVERVELPFPATLTAPEASADIPTITQLDTWIWPSAPWEQRTASASLAGVSATGRAVPTLVTIDPGDGTPAYECATPEPYEGQASADGAACTHVYTRTTQGSPYTLTVSVTWEFSYTCAGSPGCGALADIAPVTLTETRPVHVAQIRPVVTD